MKLNITVKRGLVALLALSMCGSMASAAVFAAEADVTTEISVSSDRSGEPGVPTEKIEETKAPTESSDAHVEETEALTEESGAHVEETEALTEESGAHVEETETPTEESNTSTGETGAETEESRVHVEETGAPTEESGVLAEETGAETEESGVLAEETGAPTEESGVSAEETETLTEESGASADETEAATEESGALTEAQESLDLLDRDGLADLLDLNSEELDDFVVGLGFDSVEDLLEALNETPGLQAEKLYSLCMSGIELFHQFPGGVKDDDPEKANVTKEEVKDRLDEMKDKVDAAYDVRTGTTVPESTEEEEKGKLGVFNGEVYRSDGSKWEKVSDLLKEDQLDESALPEFFGVKKLNDKGEYQYIYYQLKDGEYVQIGSTDTSEEEFGGDTEDEAFNAIKEANKEKKYVVLADNTYVLIGGEWIKFNVDNPTISEENFEDAPMYIEVNGELYIKVSANDEYKGGAGCRYDKVKNILYGEYDYTAWADMEFENDESDRPVMHNRVEKDGKVYILDKDKIDGLNICYNVFEKDGITPIKGTDGNQITEQIDLGKLKNKEDVPEGYKEFFYSWQSELSGTEVDYIFSIRWGTPPEPETTESTTGPTESTTESTTGPTEPTTESTTGPTESTTEPTESTTEPTTEPTESTTEPTTESTESTTEPTTEPTESTTEPTTEPTTSTTPEETTTSKETKPNRDPKPDPDPDPTTVPESASVTEPGTELVTESETVPAPRPPHPGLPDPNDPDSPDTITIEEDGVPKTYFKVWDPVNEEWVYILDDEVPLADFVPQTGDDTRVGLWAALATVSLIGAATLAVAEKRRKKEND